MKLWKYIRKCIKEVETNKSITWSNLRPALQTVYYGIWEKSYYAIKVKEQANRRDKFLGGV